EHLPEGIIVVLVLGEGVHIALLHHKAIAVGKGRDAQGLGDVVDVALPGEHGLGDAVATHGAGGGAVGVHRPAVALHIGAGIELGEAVHALGTDTVAVGGVGALVGVALNFSCGEGAVGTHPGDDVGADGVADAVGDEGLLAAAVQLHQPAAHLGAEPGAQGLVEGVLLVAEAAADVGLDDAHLAPGDSQRLADHAADDVGNLGGGGDDDAACLHLGKADVIFNVAVLNGGGVVPALYLDKSWL